MTLAHDAIVELGTWDAVETAARIRAKDVSAVEVVEAAITRAEEAAPLRAVVGQRYERALAAARGVLPGPLAGVPTFVKDLAQLEGVPTGWGTGAIGHYVSRRSDPFVRHFEDTGVVYLGKSAAPELGLTATTEPLGKRPCRNPWNPAYSTGGSSGGAGCLVAAGVVPIAHASDGGGSIRIPASVCGLVGLKPSRFRMDMEGSNLLPINLATDGVVSRTVRDTVAFYDAIEARYPPTRVRPVGSVARRPAKRLRIGVCTTSPLGRAVHPESRDAALGAARLCASLGHVVEEIGQPFDGSVLEDFLKYWGFLAWLQVRSAPVMLHWGFDRARLEPLTEGMAAYFTTQRRAVAQAIVRLRRFAATYAETMTHHDVLLTPTLAAPPPLLGHLATNLEFETMFERLKDYVPFTPLQNAAGAPAISLPLARAASGLPIGVQFAAAAGADRLLLELAFELEEAAPWEKLAPRRGWLGEAPG